jgi:hypothetical protein
VIVVIQLQCVVLYLSAVIALLVSIVIDSECALSVGIRTLVHDISKSGRSIILRLSQAT